MSAKLYTYMVIEYANATGEGQDADDVERICKEWGAKHWRLVSYHPNISTHIKPYGHTLATRFVFEQQLGGDDGIYLA